MADKEERILIAVLSKDDPAEFHGLWGSDCPTRQQVLETMKKAANPYIEPCGDIQGCFVPKMVEAILNALLWGYEK